MGGEVEVKVEKPEELQETNQQAADKKKRRKKKRKKTVQVENYDWYVTPKKEPDVEIEYVASDDFELVKNTAGMEEFAAIFQKFAKPEELTTPITEESEGESTKKEEVKEEESMALSDDEMKDEEDEDENNSHDKNKPSKKERKRLKSEQIALLKQTVDRPELVEVHDVNATDPEFLVYLKSYRNTVPVPRHWSQRRKYLQGKRGIEKPPFELPEFIRATGIATIRQALLDKETKQKLKTKARERVQPKMGKISIDYQVLYDAFFKYQTKPKLTGHSELYYEGKEYEVNMTERRPGHLSRELREALGMGPPEGAGLLVPPPWLINMQRHGPPPSYPNLCIPGLNAPLPAGASYGYHPGGWGKPPVDEFGRPLYGDAFGEQNDNQNEIDSTVERSHWGELQQFDDEEEEEETTGGQEEEEEEEEEEEDEEQEEAEGAEDESGISSVSSGMETPDSIDLRKQKAGGAAPAAPRQLFQVLQQQETSVGAGLMGSAFRYTIPGAAVPAAAASGGAEKVEHVSGGRQKSERTDVTFDPSELEAAEAGLTDELIRKKYQEQLRAEREARQSTQEDFSDMVAEQSAKRKRKREGKTSGEPKAKRHKDFKF